MVDMLKITSAAMFKTTAAAKVDMFKINCGGSVLQGLGLLLKTVPKWAIQESNRG